MLPLRELVRARDAGRRDVHARELERERLQLAGERARAAPEIDAPFIRLRTHQLGEHREQPRVRAGSEDVVVVMLRGELVEELDLLADVHHAASTRRRTVSGPRRR